MSAPVNLDLPYVYADVDRHGNVRIYFWRGKGHRKVRMRETVGSPAFHQRYGELIAPKSLPAPNLDRTPKAYTFRWLCIQFLDSPEFKRLNKRTQYVRRRIFEAMFDEPIYQGAKERFAEFPLGSLTTAVLEILRDRKSEHPEAANSRVKALRRVFVFGTRKRYVLSNIARDIEYIRTGSDGWHSWKPEELDKFERQHPLGSKARLALDLLQYTGASRSDVIALGGQNVREGRFAISVPRRALR